MTTHLAPDNSNYSESQRAHNVAASDKLLALLYKYHGRHVAATPAVVAEPKPVAETEPAIAPESELVVAPEPEPATDPVITYGPRHYIFIQRVVAKHFGVSRLDLIGQSRRKRYAIPRQVAMFLIHDGKRTLPEIGRRFGGRDHTTVLHAVRKIERWIEQDLHNIRATIAALRVEIGQ